jgi:hypothetical protein
MAQDPHPSLHRTAWTALRAWLGLTLAGVGAVLLWYGWYRVAGEALVAAQLPYLVSASLPGAALVVAGIVLVGSELSRRSAQGTDEMIAALYRLFTEEDTPPPEPSDPPPG